MYFKFISSGTKREEKEKRIKKSRRDIIRSGIFNRIILYTLQQKASYCVDKYGERERHSVCLHVLRRCITFVIFILFNVRSKIKSLYFITNHPPHQCTPSFSMF